MNIPIQDWLKDQKISPEAESSFNESFICFKSGAYKSAMLFAYLGFMNVIRDRIANSPCPNGVPPAEWGKIQTRVNTVETWDTAVFNAIQQKTTPIFLIPDDLRSQVGYWKDRRNDCAHSKQNKIISAHVEAFYAFIESNLGKFIVNGSKNEIYSRILNHFNQSLTPPNQPMAPIIHDLPNAVLANELIQFLRDLCIEFDNSRDPVQQMLNQENPAKITLFASCFQEGTEELQAACKKVILENDDFLLAFLRKHPDKSYILQNNAQKVRQIWHDKLFRRTIDDDFPLLCSFLRSLLIPEDQYTEAFALIISLGTAYIPTDIDNDTLTEHGFYEILINAVVNEHLLNNFYWANNAKGLIVKCLLERPISLELATEIYRVFNQQNHPWHLAEYLNDFFQTNPAKKAEYLNYVGQNNVDVPQALTALAM